MSKIEYEAEVQATGTETWFLPIYILPPGFHHGDRVRVTIEKIEPATPQLPKRWRWVCYFENDHRRPIEGQWLDSRAAVLLDIAKFANGWTCSRIDIEQEK